MGTERHLSSLIEEWHSEGKPNLGEIRDCIRDIATTLAFAHKNNIIHRDLKPANILVSDRKECRYKITDFGIGKVQSDLGSKVTQSVTGSHTALYASPEQKQGQYSPAPDDDVFSLAVIWYQMLVGNLSEEAPRGRMWLAKLRTFGLSDAELELMSDCFEHRPHRPKDASVFLSRLSDDTPFAEVDEDPEPAPKPHPPKPPEPRAKELVSKTTGMKFATIPAGSFQMGSSPAQVQAYLKADPQAKPEWLADEQPQHLVQITKPFELGVYPVTQGEYAKVMGSNPSHFAKVDGEDTTRFPVESVSWFDAIEFCNKLSEKDGFSPAYNMTNIKRESGSIKAATVSISDGNGYRLPSEAEWEYACRAGMTTAFHFGDVLNGDRANIDGNYPFGTTAKGHYLQRTTTVGSYLDAKNKFGLFDTHGNAWEWCFDYFDANAYKNRSGATNNPVVDAPSEYRVLRGGSWNSDAWFARSAVRLRFTPDYRYDYFGFRVAR